MEPDSTVSTVTFSNVAENFASSALLSSLARWASPRVQAYIDAIEFVDELPHTATGKLSKKDLRDKYRDYRFANAEAMVGRD